MNAIQVIEAMKKGCPLKGSHLGFWVETSGSPGSNTVGKNVSFRTIHSLVKKKLIERVGEEWKLRDQSLEYTKFTKI